MKSILRKQVSRHAFPGLLLLAISAPGFAANVAEGYTLTPFVGGYSFDDDQNLETSPVFGLRGGYNFTERWTAELAASYVLAESELPNYPETDAYSYGIDALYHFNPSGTWVPFLVAGVGASNQYRPAAGQTDNSDWTYNIGGGLKYFLSDAVALRGDIRDVMLPEDSRTNWEYSIGVTFLLGDKATPAAAATCPVCVVAAKDTLAPFVTLALPYNGSVDVPTHRKIRVAFSEAIDPDSINDKTMTVSQGKTLVPGTVVASTATSASFTQTTVLAPGTLYTGRITTGARDLAGNPLRADYVWTFKTTPVADPKTVSKVVFIDKFVMLEDTNFEFDKATLSKGGKSMLDQNIQIMKENPTLKVRIAGYSSAQGTVAYNQELSERRADAVVAYLVDEGGIDPVRLDSIGYGESRPANYEPIPADIRSKAAKSNMRVLFEIIVK